MKKILLAFLLIPLIISSQNNLDLALIETINSKKNFQKVMIENGFQKIYSIDDSTRFSSIRYENETKTIQADIFMESGNLLSFAFIFKDPKGNWPGLKYRNNDFVSSWALYKKIVKQIKSTSEFKFIDDRYEDYDAIYYVFNGIEGGLNMDSASIGYYTSPNGGNKGNDLYWDVGIIQFYSKLKL